MSDILKLGVILVGLASVSGCGGGPAPDIEKETKALNESPEYEKQMMGEMGGTEATPSE